MIATSIINGINSENSNKFVPLSFMSLLFNICHLDVRKLLFICICIQHTDEDLVKSKRLFYIIF